MKSSYFCRSVPFALAALLGIGSAANSMGNNPVASDHGSDATRTKNLLCEGWSFHLGDVEGAEEAAFDDSAWRVLDLPHDWSIELPFDPGYPGGGSVGYLPGGIGWYRKSFTVPEEHKGKRVFIDFDGVYMDSQVWINGHLLGRRPNGYVSFRYDLTPHLHYGGEANMLVVRANVEPNGSRWYPGAGIYRRVWLTTVNPIHIAHWGTYVTTPEVTDQEASVNLRTTIQNTSDESVDIIVKSVILDGARNRVAEATTTGEAVRGEPTEIEQTFVVKNPKLWSVDSPNLYRVVTEVFRDGDLLDEYETPLGIRTFEFTLDRGFILNGKEVDIKGVCLHHDFGCIGTAVYPRAIEQRLEQLKEMGCNAIRTSHNPHDPAFYEACDRMGFLVMNEAFDVWEVRKLVNDYHKYFKEWSDQDLTSMIMRDRNHPSVILWSIGNEIKEQHKEEYEGQGYAISKRLSDICKKLDPGRPVTAACNSPNEAKANGFAEPLDVFGFNYSLPLYEKLKGYKPIIGSENSTSWSTRGCYPYALQGGKLEIERMSGNIECSAYGNAWFSLRAEETLLALKKAPWVAGQFAWTGYDYLGECTPFHWPARHGHFGIIDLVGFPKDMFYLYQSQWTDEPMVHLVPQNWNWSQYPTRQLPVWAFSNCEEIELFLNGKSLGIQTIDGEELLHAEWYVGYTPGVLRAEGRIGGKVVCSDEVHTTGEPVRVEVVADRTEITADGYDLSFLEARLLDKNGRIVPDADMLLKFSISGEGKILGVGSGEQANHESFVGNQHRTFRGLCRVVIKSTRTPGAIHFTATSEDLEPGSVIIQAKQ